MGSPIYSRLFSQVALSGAVAIAASLVTVSIAGATEINRTDIAIESPAFSKAIWNAYQHINESAPNGRHANGAQLSEFTAGAGTIRCRIVPRPPSVAPQCYLVAGKWETTSEGVASYKWFAPAAKAADAVLFEQMNVKTKKERTETGITYTKSINVLRQLPYNVIGEDGISCFRMQISATQYMSGCNLSQGFPKPDAPNAPAQGSASGSRRF